MRCKYLQKSSLLGLAIHRVPRVNEFHPFIMDDEVPSLLTTIILPLALPDVKLGETLRTCVSQLDPSQQSEGREWAAVVGRGFDPLWSFQRVLPPEEVECFLAGATEYMSRISLDQEPVVLKPFPENRQHLGRYLREYSHSLKEVINAEPIFSTLVSLLFIWAEHLLVLCIGFKGGVCSFSMMLIMTLVLFLDQTRVPDIATLFRWKF